MVRFFAVETTQQGSSPTLGIGARIFWIYFRLTGDIRSMGEDISNDYKEACGDFINQLEKQIYALFWQLDDI